MIYLIAFITVILFLFFSGYYFYKVGSYPTYHDYENSLQKEIDNDMITREWYDSLSSEEIFIESDYGYKLHGFYIDNDSKKTIIVCHGYTSNCFASYKYAKQFIEKGFNALLINQRSHGQSGGKNVTMGYYEKFDLKKWVDYLYENKGADIFLGTTGESMGAATVLMHAGIDDRVDFVVADCPFDTITNQLNYRLKVEYKLPSFPFITFGSIVTKLIDGYFYGDVSPIKSIENIDVPVLLIHGDQDDYIPKEHSINLYNKKRDKKELFMMAGAKHALSYSTDVKKYREVVLDFITKYNLT